MKAALSLTLVLALMTSALPLTAQERIDRTAAGPISRAMTLDAVRLAAEPAAVDAGQRAGKSTNADWSRVRKLEPGTEITVTANGSQPSKRNVLSADEAGITVLNLADPTLPAAGREVLRDVASTHPEYFPAAKQGRQFILEKSVRMGPDGVFVADLRVAGLDQIAQTLARTDVVEIDAKIGSAGHKTLGTVLGVFGGAFLGMLCKGTGIGSGDSPGLGCAYLLAPIGAVAGGLAGRYAFTRKTEVVIYRAP
jgi:hypothetical protein